MAPVMGCAPTIFSVTRRCLCYLGYTGIKRFWPAFCESIQTGKSFGFTSRIPSLKSLKYYFSNISLFILVDRLGRNGKNRTFVIAVSGQHSAIELRSHEIVFCNKGENYKNIPSGGRYWARSRPHLRSAQFSKLPRTPIRFIFHKPLARYLIVPVSANVPTWNYVFSQEKGYRFFTSI